MLLTLNTHFKFILFTYSNYLKYYTSGTLIILPHKIYCTIAGSEEAILWWYGHSYDGNLLSGWQSC